MDSLVLAGLVKRLYSNFNMGSFENRLKLQKMVYIMRSFGLDLGYHFNLYHYGPYSSTLTRDAFDIENWHGSPQMKFDEAELETKFNAFLKFLNTNERKDKIDWLEIASTLLLIKDVNPSYDKTKRVSKCKEAKEKYPISLINSVYIDLVTEGII